jgi:purine-binding chemotaxis protein CheW
LEQLLIMCIDQKSYGLPLKSAERVIHAVEVSPLPGAYGKISGIINYNGKVIPVFNTRKLFQLPEKEIDPTDKFIITISSGRKIILVADEVPGVTGFSSSEVLDPQEFAPGLPNIEGIINRDNNMIIIYNPQNLVEPEEEKRLSEMTTQSAS